MKLKYFKLMDKEERAEYDYRVYKKLMSRTAYNDINSAINISNLIFISMLALFMLATYDKGQYSHLINENLTGFFKMITWVCYYLVFKIGYSLIKELYLWYREYKIVKAVKRKYNLKNGGFRKWITDKKKKS